VIPASPGAGGSETIQKSLASYRLEMTIGLAIMLRLLERETGAFAELS